MPTIPVPARRLVAGVLLALLAACSSGSGSTPGGQLRVACPAPTKAAFAQTRFVTAANQALGLVDSSLFEPARAGRLTGNGAAAVRARAAADRAVRTGRRDLRRAAAELRTNAPLCRDVGPQLERLDAGLAAFPAATRAGTASAAATRLRGAAQAVIAAAARQNLQLTPTVGDTQ